MCRNPPVGIEIEQLRPRGSPLVGRLNIRSPAFVRSAGEDQITVAVEGKLCREGCFVEIEFEELRLAVGCRGRVEEALFDVRAVVEIERRLGPAGIAGMWGTSGKQSRRRDCGVDRTQSPEQQNGTEHLVGEAKDAFSHAERGQCTTDFKLWSEGN